MPARRDGWPVTSTRPSVRFDFKDGRILLSIESLLPADLQDALKKWVKDGAVQEDRFFPLYRLFRDREIPMEPTPAFKPVLEHLKKRYGVALTVKVETGHKHVFLERPSEATEQAIGAVLKRATHPWGRLRKLSRIGNVIQKLEDLGASITMTPEARTYIENYRRSNTVVFEFLNGDVVVRRGFLRRAFNPILDSYFRGERLDDVLNFPRVAKLLKGKEGWLTWDATVAKVYRLFATNHVSILPSPAYFHHIDVLFDEKHLNDRFKRIVNPFVDEFHLLTEYGSLDRLVEALKAEGCHVRVYPEIQPIIERHATVDAGDLPVRMKQPLYDYQKKGALFLALSRNALLADEMGLGKTVQALAAFEYLKKEGAATRALVVAPASLKLQWSREIEKFSDEPCVVVRGDPDARRELYRTPAALYVVNYELVLKDFDAISALKPDLIVLDEAQRIKNFQSKTSQLIRQLPKKFAFALTGTPLENQLMELYTILRFVNPQVLGTNVQKFMNRYVVKNFFGGVVSYKHVDEVRKKVSAVILRRVKREVMDQLPERVENTFRLDLSEPQAKLYKAHKKNLVELLKKREEWSERDLHQAFGHLTYLIEICDTAELLEEETKASSKLDELFEVLEPVLQSDHKVLIFSQFERMTAIIEREAAKKKIPCVRFYGQLNEKQRQAAIDAFMTQPEIRLFISTDAGALGLNLQAADYVINFDLPWNPAKLEQRIARAHRIGQKRTVNVVNLVTTKTVEGGILKVLYRKRKLFAEIFDYLETEKLLKNATQARDLIAALIEPGPDEE